MAFLDDIKSKHLSNFVLVTIGEDICISTQKITFDDKYYKPVLLNIPSISESLDIEQRKYKISSVSLSISDYLEDGERFSDTLNTVMNKEVVIWYASQSCSTLDDCYKAGTYIVRSFSQDEDKVTLNCEDLSQDKLHIDLPLATVSDTEDILEKYRAKPKPMIFGIVDKSPCIIENENDEQVILADYNPSDEFHFNQNIFQIGGGNNTCQESPLFIFHNDSYVNISQHKLTGAELTDTGEDNFELDTTNGLLRLIITEENDTIDENLRIISFREPVKVHSVGVYNNYVGDAYIEANNMISVLDGDNSNYAVLNGGFGEDGSEIQGTIDPKMSGEEHNAYYSKAFRVYFEKVSTINTSDIALDENNNPIDSKTWVYYKLQNKTHSDNDNNVQWIMAFGGLTQNSWGWLGNAFDGTGEHEEFRLENQVFISNQSHLDNQYRDSITGNDLPISNFNWHITDNYDSVSVGYWKNSFNSGTADGALLKARFRLYNIFVVHAAVIKGIDKYNFFVSATGRGGYDCNPDDIFSSIIVDELGFTGGLETNNISLGEYAFTIDKKINSKKLIEELSQSTPLYPYFKDGQFRVKSIKTNYDGTNIIIKSEDVIKYKYDRTKIEAVYTSCNIKFHYDYGLKDFTKETGEVFPSDLTSIDGYLTGDNTDYFGQDFDQEFVFESKYIRDEPTALNLAKYLVGLHANQHNLINLTLPLNYLTLELGDIVKFDNLIQDRKIFGEDYTTNNTRNGQNIYPLFFIEKIKKSLDKVEVTLYQLHTFDTNTIVYGCTDPSATEDSYNPEANTDDGSCEYAEIVEGCTNPLAFNYNSEANTDNNSCIMPVELQPPTINTPTDGQVYPIEFLAEQLGSNLIPFPADNSTFDTTSAQIDDFLTGTATFASTEGVLYVEYEGLEILWANDWIGYIVWNTQPGMWQGNGIVTDAFGDAINGWYLTVSIGNQLMNFNSGDSFRIQEPAQAGHSWEPFNPAGNLVNLNIGDNFISYYAGTTTIADGMRLNLGDEILHGGSTYRITFRYRTVEGEPTYLRVSYGNITSDNVPINIGNAWTDVSIDLTMELDSTNVDISIYFGGEDGESFGLINIDIDDIYLNEVLEEEGGLDIPVANIQWNPSANLLSGIPELGIETTGNYYIKIENMDGVQLFSQPNITTSDYQPLYNFPLDFDSANIPQNISLKLTVGCTSATQYLGNPAFTSDNTVNGFPVAEDYAYFSWGETGETDDIIVEEGVLGDVSGDGLVNVTDIIEIIQYILVGDPLTEEQLIVGDVNEDGIVNVIDIVDVVQMIIGD